LAWEQDIQNEDDIFYTPPESPIKEYSIGSVHVVSNKGIHLEVNNV
jgi:hypothetical protein